jgi:hypothetical protein
MLAISFLIALIAGSSSFVAGSPPAAALTPVLQDSPQAPPVDPAPVIFSVEEEGNTIRLVFSPWRVVVSRDHDGIRWACDTNEFEIELPERVRNHFVETQRMPAGERLVLGPANRIELTINQDLTRADKSTGDWGMVAGSYMIRIHLSGDRILEIDPDHIIDERG